MNLSADVNPRRVFGGLQDLFLALAIRGVLVVSATDPRRGCHVILVVVLGRVQLVVRAELGVGATGVAPGKGIARSLLGKRTRRRVAAASAQSEERPEERPEGGNATDK